MPDAEQGPHGGYVEPGPGPVDDGVEQLLHASAGGEDQVPGVLQLVDRIGVVETAGLLVVVAVEPETQAGGVDPGVDDLAQTPCSPRLGQGVCDLGQAFRCTDPGETVSLLHEPDPRRLRGRGDVLVAVEDDLGAERWVTAHLDHQMSPGRVHDVEGVVVDELAGLLQIADPSRCLRPDHFPHGGGCFRDQDQEHPGPDGVGGQIVLRDPMLPFPGAAGDHLDLVRGGPGPDPAGEPARQPHQMRVVQRVVAVVVPASPPHPEPARIVPESEVGVDHDPVHTVIAAGHQLGIAGAQLIHPPTVRRPSVRDQSCPEGATDAGRSPGIGVESCLLSVVVGSELLGRCISLDLPYGRTFKGETVSEIERLVADPTTDIPTKWVMEIGTRGLGISVFNAGPGINIHFVGDSVPIGWQKRIRSAEQRLVEWFGTTPTPEEQAKASEAARAERVAREQEARRLEETRQTVLDVLGLRTPEGP